MYADRFRMEEMFKKIMERFDRLDEKLETQKQVVHPLDGDKLLDNQDMCQLLGVTKRTLTRYRQKDKVKYYKIDGKAYYKATEIKDFLKSKGKSFNKQE